MAEKERVKMEEKLHREREEAIEEAKLAMERERMKMDFEREKEKVRRKEVCAPLALYTISMLVYPYYCSSVMYLTPFEMYTVIGRVNGDSYHNVYSKV